MKFYCRRNALQSITVTCNDSRVFYRLSTIMVNRFVIMQIISMRSKMRMMRMMRVMGVMVIRGMMSIMT